MIWCNHYIDVTMTTMASQITSLTVIYSIVYSDADQRKHQSSASLAFVWGIHRDRWIPRTKASYVENVSIWWRHHECSWTMAKSEQSSETELARDPLHWDILRYTVKCSSSWWMQMAWHQIGARPSATTMLSLLWLQHGASSVTISRSYDHPKWRRARTVVVNNRRLCQR